MADEKKRRIKTKVKKSIAILPGVETALDQIAKLAIDSPSNAEITISYKMVAGEVTNDEFNTGGELSAEQQKLGKVMYSEVVSSFKDVKEGKITVKFSSTYEEIK
ncbi:hypothetical protein N9242_02350 [Vicingaceae bacterium]|jgi:hypothetical protein|nr:hypothetical protein [Vicingaceae bacterium]